MSLFSCRSQVAKKNQFMQLVVRVKICRPSSAQQTRLVLNILIFYQLIYRYFFLTPKYRYQRRSQKSSMGRAVALNAVLSYPACGLWMGRNTNVMRIFTSMNRDNKLNMTTESLELVWHRWMTQGARGGPLLPANLIHNCKCKHHETSQKANYLQSVWNPARCDLTILWKSDECTAQINEKFYWFNILKLFRKRSNSLTDPLVF